MFLFVYESECDNQRKIFWWLSPPLIVDKMTYNLVMQFSDEAVRIGFV